MWDDPIVEEVHQIRCQIAAECQYDMNALYAAALQIQQNYASQRLITQAVEREEEAEKKPPKPVSRKQKKTRQKGQKHQVPRQKVHS
jgi:hypothetical protein